MRQGLSILTLGVDDLSAARAFYARLGWREAGASKEGIAFFQLNGMALALYPRDKLAEDARAPIEGRGATLAHCLASEAEVDETLAMAERAGARIVKPARKAFWGGYSGYFADPDGWLWEIAHNPFAILTEDGGFRIDDGDDA